MKGQWAMYEKQWAVPEGTPDEHFKEAEAELWEQRLQNFLVTLRQVLMRFARNRISLAKHSMGIEI
jgi:hypothetical protein